MKIKWLKKKWKERDKNGDVDNRAITVEDAELQEEFNSEPRLYGDVMVSEDEMKVLRLPPKFGIYKKLSATQCKIDVEVTK